MGIRHGSVWKRTPGQNGHVESCHKTLKKEYLRRREVTSCQEVEEILADAFRLQPRKNLFCHRIHGACRVRIAAGDEE